MAWFRVSLSEDEQQVVREQRELHSDPYVRRRMWTLWLLHGGRPGTRPQNSSVLIPRRWSVSWSRTAKGACPSSAGAPGGLSPRASWLSIRTSSESRLKSNRSARWPKPANAFTN